MYMWIWLDRKLKMYIGVHGETREEAMYQCVSMPASRA